MQVTRRTLLKAAPAAMLAYASRGTAAALSRPGDLLDLSAVELAAAIHARSVSARELMQAYLARVSALNPRFNAIVSAVASEQLLQQAAAQDADAAKGRFHGALHGIPHAVKDTAPVQGILSTQGSPLLRDNVPAADSLVVSRMRGAGLIFTGKTNVPEFALGSHSYNPLFGVTHNAYAPGKSAGGSSGGSAVALALRMTPLGDGSDFGGSLRNPAGWNNVFGFRPSFGRVPSAPSTDVFGQTYATSGPMARNVDDLALMLSIQAGADPRAPFALKDDPAIFARPLARDWKHARIGWLGDLGGALPMEDGVIATCEQALSAFRAIGMQVDAATLDEPADAMWRTAVTLRHLSVGADLRNFAADPARRAQMKPEALWEVDGFNALTAAAITEAQAGRTRIFEAFRKAFTQFDFLLLPTAQVFPFDVDVHWPTEIAGRQMDSYHRWMEVTLPATMAGLPALAVPAGFGGAQRLPMGLQIIGPMHADLAVLQLAHAYERASPWIGTSLPEALVALRG